MSKKTKTKPSSDESTESGFFTQMYDANRKKVGAGGIFTAGDPGKYYWGIPLPWLPFQWMIGGFNVLPYGHSIEVAGPPGSFKTTLSLELIRVVCSNGGLGVYIDAEGRVGPTLISAIIGTKYAAEQVILVRNTETMDDWMKAATDQIAKIKKLDPDSKHPVLMVVDSVGAKMTSEEQEKFLKEGMAAARGFPVSAMAMTKFVKGLPSLLYRDDGQANWPIVMLFVNHLKEKPEGRGKYSPGGSGKDYWASLRIWVSVESKYDDTLSSAYMNSVLPRRLAEAGVKIVGQGSRRIMRLLSQKSSLGPGHRRLSIDLYWGWDQNNVQHMWFDHDMCLMSFLADKENHQAVANAGVIVTEAKARRFNIAHMVDGKRKTIGSELNGYESVAALEEHVENVHDKLRAAFHVHMSREHVNNRPMTEVFSA